VTIVTIFIIIGFTAGMFIAGWTAHKIYRGMEPKPTVTVTKTIREKPLSEDATLRSCADEIRRSAPSLTDALVASIVGNAWGESKCDPSALEASDSTPDPRDDHAVREWATGGHGVGVMQWTGGRASSLFSYADSKGGDWKKLDVQVEFLMTELGSSSSWRTPIGSTGRVTADGTTGEQEWKQATDVKTASDALLLGFVRPADPGQSERVRLKAALAAYEYLQEH
jgi:hypothetical protein